MKSFRVFKQIPRLLLEEGCFERISEFLDNFDRDNVVGFVDLNVARLRPDLVTALSKLCRVITRSVDGEPTCSEIDSLADSLVCFGNRIDAVIGVGGGSTLDVAKAVSVLLTNKGKASDYQGWDLVKNPGVYKVGIPTIFGSGAEASRTAVLSSVAKKQGINSDHSMFDAILIDPDLDATLQQDQRFFSAMDCYIHCVESLEGQLISPLAKVYASKALGLCESYFDEGMRDSAKIALASYLGGASIVNSEVGLCHALSYGVSQEFNVRHGEANCIVFRHLRDTYGKYVDAFNNYLANYEIELPAGLASRITDPILERMVAATWRMERPLENTFGEDWIKKVDRAFIGNIYKKI